MHLTFAIETSIEAQTNPNLQTTGADPVRHAKTALGFGLLTQTRSQQFSIDTAASLRTSGGAPRSRVKGGLADPFLGLKYSRTAKNATLRFAASVRETDIAQDRQSVADATLVSGTGKQRRTGAEIGLKLRENTPFGFGVLAAWQDVGYQDGTALGVGGKQLNDTRRRLAQVSLRLDLDAVTRLNTELEYRTFREAGVAGSKDSFDIAAALEIDRPLGTIEVSAGYLRTEDGQRLSGSVQRDYALPMGKLVTGVGLTRAGSGDIYTTGALRFQTALNDRSFGLTLMRDIASSDLDDAEQITTNLGMLYQIDMTRFADMQLSIDWSDVKDTRTRLSSSYRVIGVAYGRALTPEVKLNLGIRQRYIRDDVTGVARSNDVYLSVTRQFKSQY